MIIYAQSFSILRLSCAEVLSSVFLAGMVLSCVAWLVMSHPYLVLSRASLCFDVLSHRLVLSCLVVACRALCGIVFCVVFFSCCLVLSCLCLCDVVVVVVLCCIAL